ncbi:isoprenyl transferase [Paenibacillus aurantius]|uniref:Isoprenyl transferase n=1 Tax=Paenibacillus aurantius TaxID=2918900 RepID=A0AA96RFT4_9BACL|nr:isoprenyl transferase [Paenibacillus aurantius]WNQ13765.1 isoprenyl transferase [Paenibacillus aurantius]
MVQLFKGFSSKRKPETLQEIERDKVPKHIAVIMDGNGRWARRRGLPRIAGHHAGMKTVKKITMAADELGVEILTLYAFSTENWKRPKDEVDYLMKLPQEFLSLELKELVEKNVRVRMTGWKEGLPDHTLSAVEEAERATSGNTGLILNFALNYGSRKEMIEGMQLMYKDIAAGRLDPDSITENVYDSYLKTSGLPDPDLMIRTSGELRISNFMLWQLAYTELWFTSLYWPEFSKEDFHQAIREYQQRIRRYGGL